MGPATPHAPLTAGIPTYGLRHGRYAWAAGTPPILHAFRDWDIFWITAGEATWTLADGRTLVAGRDQFVVLPPFVPAHVSESRRGLTFWFCHIDFRRVPDDAPRDMRGPGVAAQVPLAFSRRDAPGVHRAYRAVAALGQIGALDGANARAPWRLERAVIALAAELALFASARRAPGAVAAPAREIDPRVAAICHRLEESPERAWRVGGLAASVGLSVSRLNALFHAGAGISLKSAIVDARLRRAQRLLLERPETSIRAIAEASGFSSQHFFSRQFRGRFGIAPLAYRRRAAMAPG